MNVTRLDEQAERLRQARQQRGFDSAKAAAERFGFNYNTYSQHERGVAGITRAAATYARAYKVSEAWLLTGEGDMEEERTVAIVGLAGAGPDGAVLFATGDGNFGEVPAPQDAPAHVEALEVRGDSMYGIANDGWILFYEDKEPPSLHHIGELCVCWLEDERVLVKIPQLGSEPGLFHLESANARTMRDVPVRAFSIVTDIKTRRSARRYLQRNPDADVPEVKQDM